MEHRFVVEAKTFLFSAKVSKLRLEERRKGFVGVIMVSKQCASWLAATVEEAIQTPVKVDFVKDFREEGKSLLVSRGGNKAGRFLEVAAFAEGGRKGGRKGIIWIPEARSGRGWRRFVDELRSLLASVECSVGFSSPKSSSPSGKHFQGNPGLKVERSFVEVVRSPPCEVADSLQLLSSQDIDLFPVASCFERGSEGVEIRSAVDLYEMEKAFPLIQQCVVAPVEAAVVAPVEAAAKGRRNKMKRRIGHFCVELDRILCGLLLKPKGKRIRVGLLGFAGHLPKGKCLKPGSVSGPGSAVVLNRDSGPVLEPDSFADGRRSTAGEVLGQGSQGVEDLPSTGSVVGSVLPKSESPESVLVVAGDAEVVRFSAPGPSIDLVSRSGCPWVGADESSQETSFPVSYGLDSGSSPVIPSSPEDLPGLAPKPCSAAILLENGLTEPQAWLLEWLRERAQDDAKAMVMLNAMEERTRRANLVALPPDCSEVFLQMKEELSRMHPRTKGKRELLNLKSSINYGIASGPPRGRKGKNCGV
jgi:hypothetical protein